MSAPAVDAVLVDGRDCHLALVARLELVLHRRDDLAVAGCSECRYEKPSSAGVSQPVSVALATSARPTGRLPVTAVGAGVHPHAAPGRPRDRAGELEPAQPGIARPMQADGVRRAAARAEEHYPPPLASDQPSPERRSTSSVHPGVRAEHVRAETER